MTEAVAEGGFGSVTARGLAARAGVSTKTLYECYPSEGCPSLEACLVDAHLLTVSELLTDLARAGSGVADDEARVRRALGALVSALVDDPRVARLLLVELSGAGAVVARQAHRTWCLLGERLVNGAGFDPRRAELPPHYMAGLGAGVLGVFSACLLAGHPDDLRSPEVAESLARWMLSHREVPTARLRQLDRRAVRRAAEARLAAPVSSSKRGAKEGGADARSGDRALLRATALKLAVDRGRRGLDMDMADVSAASGLSRGRFRRYFESVEACLVEAVESEAVMALERARVAADRAPTRRAASALASLDADLSRSGIAVLAECGERGLRSREALIARIALLCGTDIPATMSARAMTATASAAAFWGTLEAEALSGQEVRPTPASRTYLALAPLVGRAAALATLADDQDLGTTTRTEETHS
jgi:AcrR family transcriptional regulator